MSDPSSDDKAPTDQTKLLGTPTLTILVAASMIGAGVFTTSGFTILDLHHPQTVMWAWFLGGLIATCGAVGYGLLAARITESGGEYLYLSRLVHPAIGFTAGWVSLLAGFTGAAAYAASAFESYALPDGVRPEWLPAGSLAVLLVICATLFHALHTQTGAWIQNLIVTAKFSLLAVFVVWSLTTFGSWEGGKPLPIEPRTSFQFAAAMATSLMWISLSYSGFNAAIYVAGEAKSGAQGVQRAMLFGTLLVTAVYLILNGIFVFGPTAETIAGQQDVAAVAAQAIGGKPLAIVIRLAVCLGLGSSVSAIVMAGPRVYAKMARDGLFPSYFDSPKSPPTRSVILQGVAIAIVCSIVSLQSLLSYLGMTLSLSGAATVATVFLPKNQSQAKASTISHMCAALYVLMTFILAGLAGYNRPHEAIAAVATIAFGLLTYVIWRRISMIAKHSKSSE